MPELLPDKKSWGLRRRGDGGYELYGTCRASPHAAQSRPNREILEQRARLEQPPGRNPSCDFARKAPPPCGVAARAAFERRGIHTSARTSSWCYAAARTRRLGARLPPIHDSLRAARRSSTTPGCAKNRQHRLLPLSPPFTAAVCALGSQSWGFPACGACRAGSSLSADVSRVKKGPNRASCGSDCGIREVLAVAS